jgi:aryl-alcohol dehydrogenase-like predicted oxidoreductase
MDLSRREFFRRTALATGALATGGALGPSEAAPAVRPVPMRTLGRTGFRASILAIGTGELADNEATVAAIRWLIDAGVNVIDTAPSYQGGRSEQIVGRAIQGRRARVFIATKTLARDAGGAYAEVRASLQRLNVRRIDLLMVHGAGDDAVLDAVLRRGGAVEGLERAKREGLIRHIGITSHTRPDVMLRAIRRHPFEAILVPVSPLDAHIMDFAPEVIPEARRRGIAVLGMKALKGMERATGGRFQAEELLRYAWSLPIDTLAVGLHRPEEADTNLAYLRAFRPMPARERTALETRLRPHATVENMWWKRR